MERMLKIRMAKNLKNILAAYFCMFALCNIGHIGTTDIITVVIFILCLSAFPFMDAIVAKKDATAYALAKKPALGLAFLFSTLYILAEPSLTGGFSNRLFCFVYLLFTYIGLVLLFFRLLGCLYACAASLHVFSTPQAGARHSFFLYAALILLGWLPCFLYQYPGVMTPDSLNQYRQAIGILPYSNHHPWVHTMLIRLCIFAGKAVTDDVSFGIAIYTACQMTLMALSEAFFLMTLEKQGLRRKFLFLLLAFFALIPYNALFAVTMWKDVLFAGGLLLYTTVLYRFCLLCQTQEDPAFPAGDLALFAISAICICLMRSNGWYAFLLMTPFVLHRFRRRLRTFLLLHCLIFAIVLTVKGPVMKAWDVAPTSLVEALSIPVQQIARVAANGRNLTQAQVDSLEKICDVPQIAAQYDPGLSDPMKNLLYAHGTQYLEAHKSEYFSLWLELGLKYPLDYFAAYIDQTKGYWSSQPPIGIANEGILANELGLAWQPLLRGKIIIKLYEIYSKLYTVFPGIGILWSMGGVFWLVLAALGNCMANGRKQYCILYFPSIAVMLSVMASTPVALEFRYAYAFMLTAPLLFFAGLGNGLEEERK